MMRYEVIVDFLNGFIHLLQGGWIVKIRFSNDFLREAELYKGRG